MKGKVGISEEVIFEVWEGGIMEEALKKMCREIQQDLLGEQMDDLSDDDGDSDDYGDAVEVRNVRHRRKHN